MWNMLSTTQNEITLEQHVYRQQNRLYYIILYYIILCSIYRCTCTYSNTMDVHILTNISNHII